PASQVMNRAQLKALPCSCSVFTDPEWGVTRSYQKCAFHKSESGKSGLAYHEEMGALKDGKVQHISYLGELMEGLPCWPFHLHDRVLEIGCGVGVYDPLWMSIGAHYTGLEPDEKVFDFMSSRHRGGLLMCKRYEEFDLFNFEPFDLIFGPHVFEHMEDAPGMMQKAFSQLRACGRFVLIIPNDDDLCNPDHLWFFNEVSLRSVLMRIGFEDIRINSRQRVPHEKFLYLCASKP